MENDKTRILVRFRPEISECFELQAIYEGLRVGTIANRVLREEIEKVRMAGKGHIITRDSSEFEEYETAGEGVTPSMFSRTPRKSLRICRTRLANAVRR